MRQAARKRKNTSGWIRKLYFYRAKKVSKTLTYSFHVFNFEIAYHLFENTDSLETSLRTRVEKAGREQVLLAFKAKFVAEAHSRMVGSLVDHFKGAPALEQALLS